MCFVVIEPLVFISGEFEFINLSPDVSVVQLGVRARQAACWEVQQTAFLWGSAVVADP